GNRRDKPIIEFDPEIERTLKKNRNKVRTQRSLQFDREGASLIARKPSSFFFLNTRAIPASEPDQVVSL
ncbi:hypothetical protein PIB30_113064, partial [Stylosanthes scabra]|nr:hypothetical protein [Stylosanthes scabra]